MSNTMTILVDDTDSGISYSGNWIADKGSLDNLGNFGAPMMSTSHYIKGTGSFSYTFSGTYVGVFGSSVDGSNPSRVCTVDGTTIPNNQITVPVNGIMHCQVFGLSDGKHTLVVTVPSANPNGYWFDNLLYIPSVSVSRANAMLMVEWDDPSMVYGSGWSRNGFGNTATVDGASMSIQFTGRAATWMGYYLEGQLSSATTATYTIDGGNPKSFDLMAIQSKITGGDSNQRFFTTGLLSSGTHTLKVTYNGNSGMTPLSIYSIIVQNGASADISVGGAIGASHPVAAAVTTNTNGGGSTISTGTTTSASPSNPSIPSVPSAQPSVVVIGTGDSAVTVTVNGPGTQTANLTATISPILNPSDTSSVSPIETGSTGAKPSDSASTTSGTPSTDSNSGNSGGAIGKSHSHLGAILGAVIGILALLLLFLLFFLRRRNRKQRERENGITAAQPFTTRPMMSEVSPAVDYSHSSGGNFGLLPAAQVFSDMKQPLPLDNGVAAARPSESAALTSGQQRQAASCEPTRRPSRSTPMTSSSSEPSSTNAAQSEVVVLHEDSGVRLPMGATTTRPGVTVVEMPPTYSAT